MDSKASYGPLDHALISACIKGQTDDVRKLLADGACMRAAGAANASGDTPLVLASANGHAETVAALLEHGAEVDGQNAEGTTALHAASRRGHTEVGIVISD